MLRASFQYAQQALAKNKIRTTTAKHVNEKTFEKLNTTQTNTRVRTLIRNSKLVIW